MQISRQCGFCCSWYSWYSWIVSLYCLGTRMFFHRFLLELWICLQNLFFGGRGMFDVTAFYWDSDHSKLFNWRAFSIQWSNLHICRHAIAGEEQASCIAGLLNGRNCSCCCPVKSANIWRGCELEKMVVSCAHALDPYCLPLRRALGEVFDILSTWITVFFLLALIARGVSISPMVGPWSPVMHWITIYNLWAKFLNDAKSLKT